MNKFLIFIIWLCLGGLITAQTKPYPIKENLNVSLGGNINFYNNDTYRLFPNIGYGGEVAISKWVSGCIGFRLMGSVLNSHSARLLSVPSNQVDFDKPIYYDRQYLEKYQLMCYVVDASLMFDIYHSMKNRYDPTRPRGYFLCGIGGIVGMDDHGGRDVDLLSYAGFHYDFLSFRMSRTSVGSIYIEPRIMLLQPNFDNNNYFSTFLTVSLGFNFKMNPVLHFPMYRPTAMNHDSQFWQEDWFVGLGGAVNSLSYSGKNGNMRAKLLTPVIQLTLGKYNSPCVSTRLHIDVGTLAYEDSESNSGISSSTYGYTHIDAMLNVSKWLRYQFVNNKGSIPTSVVYNSIGDMGFWERFHVEPYVGLGILCRNSTWAYAVNGGIQLRLKASQHIDVILEAQYTQLMSRIFKDIEPLAHQSSWNLHNTSLMLGVNYNIGEHRFNY